jgi:hypothetical protein
MDPVDSIIVMAASYSDEVVALLRNNYPKIRNVAVLNEDGLRIADI